MDDPTVSKQGGDVFARVVTFTYDVSAEELERRAAERAKRVGKRGPAIPSRVIIRYPFEPTKPEPETE